MQRKHMQMSCLKISAWRGHKWKTVLSHHTIKTTGLEHKIIENSPFYILNYFLSQPFPKKITKWKEWVIMWNLIEELLFANINELNSHTSTFVGYARFSGFREKKMYIHLKLHDIQGNLPLFYFIYICSNKPRNIDRLCKAWGSRRCCRLSFKNYESEFLTGSPFGILLL